MKQLWWRLFTTPKLFPDIAAVGLFGYGDFPRENRLRVILYFLASLFALKGWLQALKHSQHLTDSPKAKCSSKYWLVWEGRKWHSNRHATGRTLQRHLRSKIRWFTEFCNSHYVSQFAAFFIDARAKRSTVKSYHCIVFGKTKTISDQTI